jgi:hypothetical protein
MPFNGSGVFTRLRSWVTDANAAIDIEPDLHDTEDDGFAAGLSNVICKDGQTTITQNIPFNNKKITGLADATAATDALNRQTADLRYEGYASTVTIPTTASAATLNLDAVNAVLTDVSGTATITAITLAEGRQRHVRATGAFTLTNGASLVLPGGANIVAAAGDFMTFRGYAAGVVRCTNYTRANGTALVATGISDGDKGDITVSGAGATWTIDAGVVTYAKLQDASATQRFLGRNTAGAGDYEEVTWAQALAWSGAPVAPVAATQAEEEAASSTTVFTSPGRQHFHPGVAKAWVRFNAAGTIAASYNITSVTDNGVGTWTVNIGTDFSSANYCGVAFGGLSSSNPNVMFYNIGAAAAAGTFNIVGARLDTAPCIPVFVTGDPGAPNEIYACFFGDQ